MSGGSWALGRIQVIDGERVIEIPAHWTWCAAASAAGGDRRSSLDSSTPSGGTSPPSARTTQTEVLRPRRCSPDGHLVVSGGDRLAPDLVVDVDRFDDIAADSASVIAGAASATIVGCRATVRVLRAPISEGGPRTHCAGRTPTARRSHRVPGSRVEPCW